MKESRDLMIYSKKQTLSSKEIEAAVKLHIPGELCKLAMQVSRSSLAKFAQSDWADSPLDNNEVQWAVYNLALNIFDCYFDIQQD